MSYDHVARILNCTKLTITRLIERYRVTGRTADRPQSIFPATQQPTRTAITASNTYVTDSSLRRRLQRLAVYMSSVVTLYIVDYGSMGSGTIDHSEGRHWWGNIDFDVYVGHVSFNVGNIFSGESGFQLFRVDGGNRIYRRAREKTAPWCVRRLYRLVVDLYLWPTADKRYCHWRYINQV